MNNADNFVNFDNEDLIDSWYNPYVTLEDFISRLLYTDIRDTEELLKDHLCKPTKESNV